MRVRVPSGLMRLGARQVGRLVLNPRLPWEVQRRRLERLVWSFPVRGTSVTKTEFNGVPAEVVTTSRDGSAAGVTVVHFHGGGYCVGSPAEVRDWAAHLSARAGCRVILPDYRLAPEHPHPAALDDARAVLSVVLAEAADGPVVLSGDSAGGGIALVTALGLVGTADGAAEVASTVAGVSRVAGCILLSPWLDLAADRTAIPELVRRDMVLSPAWLDTCAEAYTQGTDRSQPAVSPLYAKLDGLPPLLIQSGTDDLLAPDAERMAVRARAAGVSVTYTRWPGLWHDFALQPDLVAAADSAVTQAAWFLAHVAS